ncbi:glycosyltransferase family 4 protein [Actinopolymorpha pittospori]
MKVGFITQWYDPEEGSAAVPGSMVRALESRGHEVEVLTGFPNYPRGRVYDGYRIRPYLRERRGQTNVHRVALYPNHDRSAVKRTANYLSFAMSASVTGVRHLRSADVCLVYSTPGTVGLVGLAAHRFFGRPFVLFIQDIWPDTVVASGILKQGYVSERAEAALHKFSNLVYRRASRIAIISPGMRNLLIERGVPEHKIDLIYNWVDESVFHPVDRATARGGREAGGFEVMYAGNIGDVQGLEVAVEAIARLDDVPDVRLRLIGDGVAVPRLRQLATSLNVGERVIFEGPRSLRDMPQVMASSDVQLVTLKDLPLFRATMPSKLQAILATGNPVIVSAPGDSGDLARRSGAGIACAAGDSSELAHAIRSMRGQTKETLDAQGHAGQRFYREELSAEVGALRLEDSLARACQTTRGNARS